MLAVEVLPLQFNFFPKLWQEVWSKSSEVRIFCYIKNIHLKLVHFHLNFRIISFDVSSFLYFQNPKYRKCIQNLLLTESFIEVSVFYYCYCMRQADNGPYILHTIRFKGKFFPGI